MELEDWARTVQPPPSWVSDLLTALWNLPAGTLAMVLAAETASGLRNVIGAQRYQETLTWTSLYHSGLIDVPAQQPLADLPAPRRDRLVALGQYLNWYDQQYAYSGRRRPP